jgi:hypothetical protein
MQCSLHINRIKNNKFRGYDTSGERCANSRSDVRRILSSGTGLCDPVTYGCRLHYLELRALPCSRVGGIAYSGTTKSCKTTIFFTHLQISTVAVEFRHRWIQAWWRHQVVPWRMFAAARQCKQRSCWVRLLPTSQEPPVTWAQRQVGKKKSDARHWSRNKNFNVTRG